jgi:branched-chain amino acid transport system permease protein
MSLFFQELYAGFAIAAIYSLLAVSLSFTYLVADVLQFAQGDVMIVGAYAGYEAAKLTNSYILALVAGCLVACATAFVMNVSVFRWLRGHGHMPPLLAGLAFSTIIEELLTKLFNDGLSVSYPQQSVSFAHNANVLNGLLIAIAFQWTLVKTRYGRAMRAVADSTDTAAAMGISVGRVMTGAFIVGAGLAGIAGVLLAAVYGSITPTGGITLEFTAIAIILFGGLGSLPGAIVGSIIIALLQTFVGTYISSTYETVATFGVMLAVIIVRPEGILPVRQQQRV